LQFARSESESLRARAPAMAVRAVAATETPSPSAELASFAPWWTDHPFQDDGVDPFPQPSPRREEGWVRGPPGLRGAKVQASSAREAPHPPTQTSAASPRRGEARMAPQGLEEQVARLTRAARLQVAPGSPARARGGGRGGPLAMARKSQLAAVAPGVVASAEAARQPRRPRRRPEKPAHPPAPAAAHDDSTLSAGAGCFEFAI
jgi:hypothetical protein